jgi:hypothetical protein
MESRTQPHLVFIALDVERTPQKMSLKQMCDLSEEMKGVMEKLTWVETDDGMMEIISQRLDEIRFSNDIQIPDLETIMSHMEEVDIVPAKKTIEFLDSIYEMAGDLYHSNKVETLMRDISSGGCIMNQLDVLERVDDITSIVHEIMMVLEYSYMQALEKYVILMYKHVLDDEYMFNEQLFWDSMTLGVNACNNVRTKWNKVKNAT